MKRKRMKLIKKVLFSLHFKNYIN